MLPSSFRLFAAVISIFTIFSNRSLAYTVGVQGDYATMGECITKVHQDVDAWNEAREGEDYPFHGVLYQLYGTCGQLYYVMCLPNTGCEESAWAGDGRFSGKNCIMQNSCEQQSLGYTTPVSFSQQRGIKFVDTNKCGSVINYYKKTVSEQIPIDGTSIYLNYSSEYNPKRKLSASLHEEVKFNSAPTGSMSMRILDDQLQTVHTGSVVNTNPMGATWLWDEQAGNTSTHPAFSKGSFTMTIEQSKPMTFTAAGAKGITVRVQQPSGNYIGYSYSTSETENIFAEQVYQVQKQITVYRPTVWGLNGWTLSNHHYFDKENKILYAGTGDKIEFKSFKTAYVSEYSANVDFVSQHDSDEVFLFDQTGQHLETRTKILGKTKYKFNYGVNHKLLGFVDIHNKTTELVYDTAGKISKIVAPYGQETLFTVANDVVTDVENSLNYHYVMQYNTDKMLTSFQKPSSEITTFTYSSNGDFLSESKNAGRNQSFTELITEASRKISLTTATGLHEIFETVSTGENKFDHYTKTAGGTVVSKTEYDGSVKKVSVNDNNFEYYEYSDTMWGNYLAEIPVKAEYHESGQNIIDRPYNNAIYSYASSSDPTSLTAVSIYTGRQYQYDNTTTMIDVAAKTITMYQPDYRTSVLYFNDKEQITRIEPSVGTPTDLTYDTSGRLIKMQQASAIEEYTYNSYGFLNTITNSKSQTTTFTTDKQGKVLSKTLPNSEVILFEYTNGGELKKITTPSNQQHNFQFGLADYVSGYLTPTNKQTSYSYDSDKRLTLIEKPSGRDVTVSYLTGSDNVNQIGTTEGNYSYLNTDAQGRPHGVTSPDGIKTEIDWVGNQVQKQTWYDSDNTVIGSIAFGFEANRFRLNQIKLNDAVIASLYYGYNGKLQYLYSPTTYFTYTFYRNSESVEGFQLYGASFFAAYESEKYDSGNKASQKIELDMKENTTLLPLGVSMVRKYDAFGQAIEYSTKTMDKNTSTLYSYYKLLPTYDFNDRLVQIEKVSGSTVNGNEVYQTDFFKQYTFASGSNGNVSSYIQRPTLTGTPTKLTAATHGTDDRLLTLSGTLNRTYTYDDDGNLKTVTHSNGTTAYDYDDFSNLKKITYPSGKTIEYKVDGMNRRVKKLVNGVVNEYYLWYDQIHLAAVLDASKTVKYSYLYGPESHAPSYVIKDGVTYKMVNDPGLGSVRYVVNPSTLEIAQELEYDEFGNIVKNTSPGFQSVGFAGGLMDVDTKLVRFGARDYDPITGRWTTKDPIGFGGGDTNLYSYVEGDPMSYIDPTGLLKIPASPNDLPEGWFPDNSHRDKNGKRYRYKNTDRYLDFHPGKPDATGWEGKDHWHDSNDNLPNGKKCKNRPHYQAGDEVPDPIEPTKRLFDINTAPLPVPVPIPLFTPMPAFVF